MKRLIFIIIALVGILAICGCGKEKVYIITFDANGGEGEMKEQVFVKNVAQPLISNAFVYELKSFSSWNTVPDGSGVAYSDAQEITINKDVTLYAQWQVSTFKITFDANGGTGNMTPMTIKVGERKYLPENTFSRDGYFFCGWARSASGNAEYSNNTIIANITEDMTLYAQWTKPEVGRQAVDLGLPSGLKWASCNVGADNPEEYGDYFAWGETETKGEYSWSNYKYCNGSSRELTKYCNNAEYGYEGFTDNLTTLEASDDAATANWGNGWRMPTSEEVSELFSKCVWAHVVFNGVNGYAIVGVNGKSIFLPARQLSVNSWGGSYWTSSLYVDGATGARRFFIDSWPNPRYATSWSGRDEGKFVRAVCQ